MTSYSLTQAQLAQAQIAAETIADMSRSELLEAPPSNLDSQVQEDEVFKLLAVCSKDVKDSTSILSTPSPSAHVHKIAPEQLRNLSHVSHPFNPTNSVREWHIKLEQHRQADKIAHHPAHNLAVADLAVTLAKDVITLGHVRHNLPFHLETTQIPASNQTPAGQDAQAIKQTKVMAKTSSEDAVTVAPAQCKTGKAKKKQARKGKKSLSMIPSSLFDHTSNLALSTPKPHIQNNIITMSDSSSTSSTTTGRVSTSLTTPVEGTSECSALMTSASPITHSPEAFSNLPLDLDSRILLNVIPRQPLMYNLQLAQPSVWPVPRSYDRCVSAPLLQMSENGLGPKDSSFLPNGLRRAKTLLSIVPEDRPRRSRQYLVHCSRRARDDLSLDARIEHVSAALGRPAHKSQSAPPEKKVACERIDGVNADL